MPIYTLFTQRIPEFNERAEKSALSLFHNKQFSHSSISQKQRDANPKCTLG